MSENPYLLDNIHIVTFSCVLLILEGGEEKTLAIVKKPFAVTTTFRLGFESQIELWLCGEHKVLKFHKPVRLHGSKKL